MPEARVWESQALSENFSHPYVATLRIAGSVTRRIACIDA